jgi:uncharacterized protein (DUF1501 family)
MTLTSNQEENHIPPSTQTGSISRRRFLGQAGAMAAGAGALSAMQLNFDAVQAAAAANPDSSGYKALVCILLAGGNDSFNMLVPDRDHAAYVAARGGLRTSNNGGVALPKSDLTTIGTDHNRRALKFIFRQVVLPLQLGQTTRERGLNLALHPGIEGGEDAQSL